MKRTLLLSALSFTLLSATVSRAQDIPVVGSVTKYIPKPIFGLKIGANFNQLSGGETFKQAYKPGILFGAFGGVHWKKVGFRVEAMINSAKYDYSIQGVDTGTFKNLYLDIPVLFEYQVIPHIWLQLGPQYSYIVSVKKPSNAEDPFNSNVFSGVLGLEGRLFHIVVGARYVLGLSDLNNKSTSGISESWNTRTIQLYAGFRFL